MGAFCPFLAVSQPRAVDQKCRKTWICSFNTPAQFIILEDIPIRKHNQNDQESCTYSIEAVVDDMLEILAHSNLFHQLVFVTVHSSKLTNMCKHILEAISQLERVHIVQSVLDMTIQN